MRRLAATTLLAATLAQAAHAEGPGQYAVKGSQSNGGGTYSGTATLTQTGRDVWRLVWNVGGERYEGFGIGDGKVISFSFTSASGSGTALYVSDEAGGYSGRWAFKGDTAVSAETLTRR